MENELIEVTAKTQPFKYLDPEELAMLITYFQRIKFASKQFILHQGKRSDGMYIILRGKALVIAKILGKNVINLALLSRGNFVGEVSFITKNISPSSVIAEGEVECLFINTAYFDMLSLFLPNIKQKILQAIIEEIVKRIKSFHHKITTILSRPEFATPTTVERSILKSTLEPKQINLDESILNLTTLKKLHFFKFLTQKELPEVISLITVLRAARHCTLIKEGTKNQSFYIVLYGAVQTSIVKNNTVSKLSVLGPLSFFASTSFIDNTAGSIFNYTTCEDAILLCFPPPTMAFLKENHPLTWHLLFNAICKSFVSLEEAISKLNVRLNNEFYNR